MTRSIALLARPIQIRTSPARNSAEETTRNTDPQEIPEAEIRHRQRSMVNALLCCMI